MRYTKEDALQALEDMDDYSRMGVPGGIEPVGAYGVLKTFIDEATAQATDEQPPAPLPQGEQCKAAPECFVLTAGEILATERRSKMTNDEALRFGRAIELKVLRALAAPAQPVAAQPALEPVAYWHRWKNGTRQALSYRKYLPEDATEDYFVTPLVPISAIRPGQLESKDAELLDWLEQHDGRFYNIDRITSIVGVGFNSKPTIREAIRAARAASKSKTNGGGE